MTRNTRPLFVEHERTVRMYFSAAGAENQFKNWGSYDDMPGIYALHSGFYPSGISSNLSQRESIKEMDRQIIRRLGLGDGQSHRLADLGCGSGAISIKVGLGYPNTEVWGVTIAPEQASAAQEYIQKHRIPNVHIGIQSYTSLGFPNSFFDRACFVESLMHAKRKEAALGEAARVLMPGGILLFQETVLVRPISTTDPIYPALRVYMRKFHMPTYEEPLETFVRQIQDAGFESLEIEDVTPKVFPSAKLIGDHAEMRLRERPNDPEIVKLRREACTYLRDLMAGFEEGTNKIGYYFITARRK